MKKLVGILILTTAFALAFAQDDPAEAAFTAFDANADEAIDQTELVDSGFFAVFDLDAGGDVDETEFATNVFTLLDVDGSGSLSEEELAGLSSWTSSETELGLTDLDTDASGDVSMEEFTQAYGAVSIFGNFDTDASGTATEDEFMAAVFAEADDNDDGAISYDEFIPRQYLFLVPGMTGGDDGGSEEEGGDNGNG